MRGSARGARTPIRTEMRKREIATATLLSPLVFLGLPGVAVWAGLSLGMAFFGVCSEIEGPYTRMREQEARTARRKRALAKLDRA